MSLTASSIQKGSIQQRASILIDSLPDPMQRINHLKKNEQRTELQSKISKTEADKLNISYQWMFQFEKMHQERKQLVEKIGSLQVDVVKKDERVKQLEIDSKKNNKTARQFKGLFQEERKTVKRLQQNLVQMCKTLQNSQQEVRQLRLCNWKKKRTIRDLKQNLKKQSSVEMNNDTESDLRTDAYVLMMNCYFLKILNFI